METQPKPKPGWLKAWRNAASVMGSFRSSSAECQQNCKREHWGAPKNYLRCHQRRRTWPTKLCSEWLPTQYEQFTYFNYRSKHVEQRLRDNGFSNIIGRHITRPERRLLYWRGYLKRTPILCTEKAKQRPQCLARRAQRRRGIWNNIYGILQSHACLNKRHTCRPRQDSRPERRLFRRIHDRCSCHAPVYALPAAAEGLRWEALSRNRRTYRFWIRDLAYAGWGWWASSLGEDYEWVARCCTH